MTTRGPRSCPPPNLFESHTTTQIEVGAMSPVNPADIAPAEARPWEVRRRFGVDRSTPITSPMYPIASAVSKTHCVRFFRRYDVDHRHSGIGPHTPTYVYPKRRQGDSGWLDIRQQRRNSESESSLGPQGLRVARVVRYEPVVGVLRLTSSTRGDAVKQRWDGSAHQGADDRVG